LQYAFDVLQANRVEFFVDSRNLRSQAAVKKIGGVEEGVLRQHIILDDGFIRDTVVLSIIKYDWPNIAESLKQKIYKKNYM
jgi:RimJ/RimL family protein N-acetyltransferase